MLISIGRLYLRLAGNSELDTDELNQHADQSLTAAATVAESIDDNRAMSYAYGYLGALYEQEGRTEDAMSYTVKALRKLAGM